MDWVLVMETMISDTSSTVLGVVRVAITLLGIEAALLMIKGGFFRGAMEDDGNNIASHRIGTMVHCHAWMKDVISAA